MSSYVWPTPTKTIGFPVVNTSESAAPTYSPHAQALSTLITAVGIYACGFGSGSLALSEMVSNLVSTRPSINLGVFEIA